MSDLEMVMVWTDGSCLRPVGPGGWAAILRFGGLEHELVGGEQSTTNNRMELMGAIAALEVLKRSMHVLLFSDSKYVVEGAVRWVPSWTQNSWRTTNGTAVKNQDLWRRLCTAAEPHNVEWQWVRGHSGQPENERCDVLAGAAARRVQEGAVQIARAFPTAPTLAEATVLARVRAVVGRELSNDLLRSIGARAVQNYRAQYKQDPPRVQEQHAEGVFNVFAYPGPAVAFIDEAIRGVLAVEHFVYQAPLTPPAETPLTS
jgi:ribonuclease HI